MAVQLHTAAQWVGAIGFSFDTLAGVLPGALADHDVEHVWEQQLPDTDDRLRHAARVAVSRAAGRDWWWAVNLTRKSLTAWPYINGKLLLANVSAQTLPFADWLDACYMMLWTNCDEKTRIKLDLELSMPPAGTPVRQTAAQKRRMLADFAAD